MGLAPRAHAEENAAPSPHATRCSTPDSARQGSTMPQSGTPPQVHRILEGAAAAPLTNTARRTGSAVLGRRAAVVACDIFFWGFIMVSFFVSTSHLGFSYYRPVPGALSVDSALWLRFFRSWASGSVGFVCPACGVRLRAASGGLVWCSSSVSCLSFVAVARPLLSGVCPACGSLFLPA